MGTGQNAPYLGAGSGSKNKGLVAWKRHPVILNLLHLYPTSPLVAHQVKQKEGKLRHSCDSCPRVPHQMWPVMEALGIETTTSTALSEATNKTTHRPVPRPGLQHYRTLKWLKSKQY